MNPVIQVKKWLQIERAVYSGKKWEEGKNDEEHRRHVEADDDWPYDSIHMYIHRANQLGLSTPSGRQALAKGIVTAIHVLETAVEFHGPMPMPGVSSGEIRTWQAVAAMTPTNPKDT